MSQWIDAVQLSYRSQLASSILLGAAGVVVAAAAAAGADGAAVAAAGVGEAVHTADTGRMDQAAVATATSSCSRLSVSRKHCMLAWTSAVTDEVCLLLGMSIRLLLPLQHAATSISARAGAILRFIA